MNCMGFEIDFLEEGVGIEAIFMEEDGHYITHHLYKDYPWLEGDEEEEETNQPIGIRFDGTLIFEEEVSE